MKTVNNYSKLARSGFVLGIFVAVLGIVLFISVSRVSERGYSPRGFGYALRSLVRSLAESRQRVAGSRGDYTNVIFLHHSTGNHLIEEGGVRQMFDKAGYEFWDHDYNHPGLRGPDGRQRGYSYNVPGDNTDPDGLARIFGQPVYRWPLNTFSALLQHEVIIIKSCFPTSNIPDDARLAELQSFYLAMRANMDRHGEKIFIILTQPPLNPAETDLETAARARRLAGWLASEEFLAGHPNIFTFDFFAYLAEQDPASAELNMLRRAYRQGDDSHPNRRANEEIAPRLVEFVLESVGEYRSQQIASLDQ